MTIMRSCLLVALMVVAAASLRADPPEDKPLPGERVGGHGHDDRVNKRIDNRVPSRLNNRVQPRTIGRPLMAATSPVTSDADNGCTRDVEQPASPAAPSTPSAPECQSPQ